MDDLFTALPTSTTTIVIWIPVCWGSCVLRCNQEATWLALCLASLTFHLWLFGGILSVSFSALPRHPITTFMNFQSSFSFWNEVDVFLFRLFFTRVWRGHLTWKSQSFITLLFKHCWHFLAWSCWHFNVYIEKLITHEYIWIYEYINMNINWNQEAHLFYTLLFCFTMCILPIFLNISKEQCFNTHNVSHYTWLTSWGFYILEHLYCVHLYIFKPAL